MSLCVGGGSGNVSTTVNHGDPQCLQRESFEAISVSFGHVKCVCVCGWVGGGGIDCLQNPMQIVLALPSRFQEN